MAEPSGIEKHLIDVYAILREWPTNHPLRERAMALAEDASQYADSLLHEESVTAELFRLINACGGACKAEVDATSGKVKGILRDVIAKTGGTKQPPDPDCETCHGSGVLNVPYIALATGGRSSKTHEARCMCTFPALAANKGVVRDIFAKLGKDARR